MSEPRAAEEVSMKIRVNLKDPDTMHDAVQAACRAHYRSDAVQGITTAQRDEIAQAEASTIQSEISDRWMPYGEYLLVEFDTETWTATVLPAEP